MALDLSADLVTLTRALCDVPSVSGDERELADLVQAALEDLGHLEVLRDGDAVVARTHLGRERRVVLAGHLDTVPVAGNLPSELREEPDGTGPVVWGRGTVDMKAGDAVLLALAAAVREPSVDVTYVFYDAEEVEADRNGLGRLVARHPDWVAGDMAVLGEPTAGALEGGCNGTLRVEVVVRGTAAHSARSWLGVNAVHGAAEVLARLVDYTRARGRGRRPHLSRGPQRGRHPRWDRRQRDPRRVRGDRQLPLRAVAQRGRGRGARA